MKYYEAFQVIGAGGHAKVIVDALEYNKNLDIKVFDEAKEGKTDSLLGKIFSFSCIDPVSKAIVAIGDNTTRHTVVLRFPTQQWGTLIHPKAIISRSAKIGEGVYIGAGASIGPQAVIGNHTIINTGSIIEHDVIVGDFCHVGPGVILTGSVQLGNFSLLGAGTTAIPNIHIGEYVVIGAGSTIIRDVPDKTKAVGSPLRII